MSNSPFSDSSAKPELPAADLPVTKAGDVAPEKKAGFIRRNSLQLAGVLNLIGDVGFLIKGFKKRGEGDVNAPDNAMMTGGGLYTLGGVNLMAFGGVKKDHSLREVSEKTAAFLKNKTGDLPEDSKLAQVDAAAHTGTLGKSLSKHAARNTLVAYGAGAGAMLVSGINEYKKDPKATGGILYGALSLFIKGISLLTPEKSPQEKSEHQKKPGNIIEWFREKPLRIFGYGSLITEGALAYKAYQEYQKNPAKEWQWTVLTTTAYAASDLLAAISSKDPSNTADKLSAEEQRYVEKLAAETIAKRPEAERKQLINEVAGFLVTQAQTNGTVTSISQELAGQVAAQKIR